MAKWVYGFGNGTAEGRAEMRNLLGGKGANLAEMSSLGLPVPPGFTVTTELCGSRRGCVPGMLIGGGPAPGVVEGVFGGVATSAL